QVLAAVLTYWAVGLAYTPLVFKGASEGDAEKSAAVASDSASDSASTAAIDSLLAPTTATTVAEAPAAASERDAAGDSAAASAASAGAKTAGGGSLLLALGALFFMVFALPVMIVAGSLPSGLISAFIIFIGIHQAWRMTGAPALKVSGPYRVGAQPSAAGA
ncbi:MAG TPA: hypothetical protein VFR95_09875, partial [Gemmatimonadaceae bacterium]|nr:hypothetical protein [Gemmatimonadaceae bacterium]